MPIQPLSEATSRVLTSTQTLNNATSVVKELVENALDARASNISIEIATNTLDKITVKDDGFGIAIQDRRLLCKRGCTSKIANLDDLAGLGGTFLGFRGTALASIAELSKEVVVITRIDGEQPGTTMTFGPGGTLLSSASASHNTGTTVRIDHFLVSIPVRRQVISKAPSKTLDGIKKLLQAYALARPSVKLSLKVLKAKSDKANWSFAACKDEDPLSAAVQVVGKSIATLCKFHSRASAGANGTSIYRLEALLLDAESGDISKAGSLGQFISVDGRPISQDKGVMRELIKKYKSHLQNACSVQGSVPSKPFCVIRLWCPDRSYDVNVEPAKDVILFHNEERVLGLADKLFVDIYGELEQQMVAGTRTSTDISSRQATSSFDVLPARTQTSDRSLTTNDDTEVCRRYTDSLLFSSDEQSLIQKSLVERYADTINETQSHQAHAQLNTCSPSPGCVSMNPKRRSPIDTINDSSKFQRSSTHMSSQTIDESEAYDPDDIAVNNPFTRAKIYSLQHPKRSSADNGSAYELVHPDQYSSHNVIESSPAIAMPLNSHRRPLGQAYQPLTPEASPVRSNHEPYQNPGPPFPRRFKQRQEHGGDVDSSNEESDSVQKPQSRQSVLNDWIGQHPMANTSFKKALEMHSIDLQPERSHKPSSQEPRSSIRCVTVQRPDAMSNKPFRPPLKSNRSTEQTETSEARCRLRPSPSTPSSASSPKLSLAVTTDDDLQYILDFEQRKKMVNQQHRASRAFFNPTELARIQCSNPAVAQPIHSPATKATLPLNDALIQLKANNFTSESGEVGTPVSSASPKKSTPHNNRYLAAKRNLQSSLKHMTDSHAKSNDALEDSDSGETQDTAGSTLRLTETDPRGYMILHKHLNESSDTARSNNRRSKSSRLPFETIPTDAVKHNLLATLPDNFPGTNDLFAACQRLDRHDTYVKQGAVEPIKWSPFAREVQHWQATLEALVKKCYRGDIQCLEGEHQDEQIPDMKIALAGAVRAHLDSI